MLSWIIAILITLSAAFYQRATGPTYPLEERTELGGHPVEMVLERTHGGDGDQEVYIEKTPEGTTGNLIWRRYPSSEEFRTVPMRPEEEGLIANLPHQPPAGKLEYYCELRLGGESVRIPRVRAVVTRFKGYVPPAVLLPHIFFMFAAMLLSNRVGIEALRDGRKTRLFAWITFVFLTLGGMIFGPIVQKYAFGAYWTGSPFGHDLTDNKTLIAFVGWVVALVALRRSSNARWWVFGAALLLFVIFLIPHSMLGSELKVE